MSEQEERIVKILELPHQEGMPWYAENYINGKELQEREKNGTLTEAHRNELVVLGRELGARQEARVLAREIGDEEWGQGNTKYAFEAYEAACVAPSEILTKAEALLEAERLVKAWKNEVEKISNSAIRTQSCVLKDRNDLHNAYFIYCTRDDCSFCSDKKVLNRTFANQIWEALGWDFSSSKVEQFGDLRVEDKFSPYFLRSEERYRAAAVAALKLVNRLERIYVTEELDIEPIASHSGIAYTK